MLGFITKKLLHSSVDVALSQLKSSKTLFKFKAYLSSAALESSTPVQSDPKGDAFTLSYLVNSCGVTVADANRISKKLHLKSTQKPDRVLNFFKISGFTDAQISSIVRFVPTALLSDPDKTLKPRLDLLASLGGSHDTVLRIISQCPAILKMSVENKIVPALDCLKKFVGTNAQVLTLLTRFHWILLLGPESSLGDNVALLCDVGMPKLVIYRFLMTNGYAFLASPERFKDMVERVLEMGFDPNKHNFGDAVNSFASVSEENFAYKVGIFKKWGWSDSDFATAFRKQPRIVLISGRKIDGIMDLLVNTMELKASFVAGCPYILLYSLENRIIPRCSVVRHLLSNGLIQKEDYSMGYVLRCQDKFFFNAFVERHAAIRSELMALYDSNKKVT